MKMRELKKFDWSEMKVTPIQGNDYYMVHERVLEFHRRYPDGVIKTEVVEISNDRFITTSKVFPYPNEFPNMFCSGTACEMIGKNKGFSGSELECCETSSVGRALGFLCIGIKHSIASADEVRNAMKKGKSSNINLNDLKEGNPKAKENAKKLEEPVDEDNNLDEIVESGVGMVVVDDMKVTFGKHKDKKVSECPLEYLDWLANKASLDFMKDRDTGQIDQERIDAFKKCAKYFHYHNTGKEAVTF